MFSPVDNNHGNASRCVQMSRMINGAADEWMFESCYFWVACALVTENESEYEFCVKLRCFSLSYVL